jgi:hypothetical protein
VEMNGQLHAVLRSSPHASLSDHLLDSYVEQYYKFFFPTCLSNVSFPFSG